MAKMTLDELKKLRESKQQSLASRETEGKEIFVIIGMGTCGIASGAKETMSAFLDAVDKAEISGVVIKQTGCMGLCYAEPTVEVRMPGMENTIYGNVNPAVAEQIVNDHLLNKKLVENHIFNRPAADITG